MKKLYLLLEGKGWSVTTLKQEDTFHREVTVLLAEKDGVLICAEKNGDGRSYMASAMDTTASDFLDGFEKRHRRCGLAHYALYHCERSQRVHVHNHDHSLYEIRLAIG